MAKHPPLLSSSSLNAIVSHLDTLLIQHDRAAVVFVRSRTNADDLDYVLRSPAAVRVAVHAVWKEVDGQAALVACTAAAAQTANQRSLLVF